MADREISNHHDQEYADKSTTTDIDNGYRPPISSTAAPLLQSDLTINRPKLLPSAITPDTRAFNRKLQEIESGVPKWYEVGAAKYRLMRKQGLTPLPAATLVPTATNLSVQSRDPGREIPCRVLSPQQVQPRGLFLHIHGGGWVLNDEASQDVYLQDIADRCGLVCLSVGYRVAPEHPYPAAPDDCFDVASWLMANARERFGTELAFIGGESAGANLAVVTALRLFRSPVQAHASLRLKGLLLHYGSYSMQWLPGPKLFRRKPTLIIDEEMMDNFREAYIPGMKGNEQQLTLPDVSPFYADLTGLTLPPALFTVGTEDCLLEDSVFMSTRWMIAGGEAILKIYPGSPHGFILFAPEKHGNAGRALQDLKIFIDMQYSSETAVESHNLCIDC